MSPDRVVLGLAGLIAIMGLVKLMRRRQEHLRGLLKTHVDKQLEWSRKKARAALMARRAAKRKAPPQDLTELTDMLHENDPAPTQSSSQQEEIDGVTLF
jgi:hypothetical protein